MVLSTKAQQITSLAPRKSTRKTISTRHARQIRLGLALGREYLGLKGKGRLNTISEAQYDYLRTITQAARDDGSLTHKAYYHVVRGQKVTEYRRLVRKIEGGLVETLFT